MAAKSIAVIPAESIPFIGVAVLIADTGYELYAACETLRNLDDLYVELGMVGETPDDVMHSVCDPQLLAAPGEVNAVRSALLEAVAEAVGGNSRVESTSSDSAQTLVFSRAAELIHKSTTPITVLELAHVAGVSIRALEYAFRAVLDTTPSNYLRLHRLNRVRQDLLAADPQVNTVSEVASRWGFTHPGRFSIGYSALFREKPSETLRKPTYMKTAQYFVPVESLV